MFSFSPREVSKLPFFLKKKLCYFWSFFLYNSKR